MWTFIFGLIIGMAIWAFIGKIVRDKIKLSWYGWLMGFLTLVFFLLLVQNFVGSMEEGESRAAWLGVLFFGVPTLILGIITVRLSLSRQRRIGA